MNDLPKKDISEIARPSHIRCWQLVMHILNRWSTLVPFYIDPGYAGFERLSDPESSRTMKMEVVWFFVPKDATHCFEIARFLDKESAFMRRPASEPMTIQDETTTMFGVDVNIHTMVFSSEMLEPYLTEGQRHKMQKEMFKQLLTKNKADDPNPEDPKSIFGRKLLEAMAGNDKHYLDDPDDAAHTFYGISPDDIQKHLPKGYGEKEEEDGQLS